VMGVAQEFGSAFARAQIGAGNALPTAGTVFLTVNDHDKHAAADLARRFHGMGFGIKATHGTASYLRERGVPCDAVHKVSVARPHGIDLIKNGGVQLLINTPLGQRAQKDDESLRQAAISHRIAYTTTLSAATAACDAIEALAGRTPEVRSLQEWQAQL